MLPRKRKVGRKLFDEVTARGALLHSSFCTFRMLRNDTVAANRYAVVVSKKVAKKAVTRNLLKRRIFAIMKGAPTSSFKGTIIVFLKKGVDTLSFAALQDHVLSLFSKMK